MPKPKKIKPRLCFAEIVLRDFVYVCFREKGHRLGHIADARDGKVVVKVTWWERKT